MVNIKTAYKDEKGIILVAVLILIFILGIIGTIAAITTTTEMKISSNYKSGVQAFYAAEAGIQEARTRLRGSPSDDYYAGDPNTDDALWSAYILTSGSWTTSSDPDYDSDYFNYVPTATQTTNTNTVANSLQTDISYWTKIRHKREYDAEQDGHTTSSIHYFDNDGSTVTHTQSTPGNIIYYGYEDTSNPTKLIRFTTSGTTIYKPVEIITVNGSKGNSSKTIKIEVIHYPGPPILAAVYSKGTATINGASAVLSGTDTCASDDSLPPVYTLDPATVEENPAPTYGGNPPYPQSGSEDIDIAEYINILKDDTTVTITSDQNGTTFGSSGIFVTCYSDTSDPYNVQGLKLQNVTGYGTLLVEGDIILGGGINWDGLILATGTMEFNGGGGSNAINISGAVLANQTIAVNGDVNISYNSCNIDKSMSNQPLREIKWKDAD